MRNQDISAPVAPVYSYYFSFYYDRSLRNLHSFPTRRSSDLPGKRRSIDCLGASDPGRAPAPNPVQLARPGTTKDRKSTRLNSSHVKISYAVFCLKKKTTVSAITPPLPSSSPAR